jgi:TonB family protein
MREMIRAMSMRLLFSIAALLGHQGSAFAADPVIETLTPKSKWQLNYEDDECRLLRTFTSDGQDTLFQVSTGVLTDQYDVLLSGPSIPAKAGFLELKISLEPENIETKRQAMIAPLKSGEAHILRFTGLSIANLTNGSKDSVMRIETSKESTAHFQLQNIKGALASLNSCQDDLLRGAGIDPMPIRSLKSQPEPDGNIGAWVTVKDYPSSALAAGDQGSVTFKLRISQAGEALDCSIIKSSSVAELDKQTCRLMMKRSRFKPAIDQAGDPTEAVWISRVIWSTMKLR